MNKKEFGKDIILYFICLNAITFTLLKEALKTLYYMCLNAI